MTRSNWIGLFLLIVLLAWIGWGLYSTARQTRLDKQLVAAVDRSDAPAVKRLLDQGADPNTREGGAPPPSWEERLKAIFGFHPRHHRYLSTPVLCVAADNHRDGLDAERFRMQTRAQVEIVRLLIAKGADVNVRDDPPLVDAAIMDHAAAIRLLLNAGADVNATDGAGQDTTALYWTALYGDAALARRLLDGGADVNARNARGDTPLIKAADKGNGNTLDCIRVLIAHGADVNARNRNGLTALGEARRSVQWEAPTDKKNLQVDQEIVAFLLRHGAKG